MKTTSFISNIKSMLWVYVAFDPYSLTVLGDANQSIKVPHVASTLKGLIGQDPSAAVISLVCIA
jgi:hypothetical protein